MSDPAQRLADAERDVAEARERLAATVSTLQAKLDPRTLARSTVDDLTDRGSAIAKTTVDSARRNPAIAATAAMLAGLLLIRRPLTRAIRARRTKS